MYYSFTKLGWFPTYHGLNKDSSKDNLDFAKTLVLDAQTVFAVAAMPTVLVGHIPSWTLIQHKTETLPNMF